MALSFTENAKKTKTGFVATNGTRSYNVSYEYDGEGNISNIKGDIKDSADATLYGSFNTDSAGKLNMSGIPSAKLSDCATDILSCLDQITSDVKTAVAASSSSAS